MKLRTSSCKRAAFRKDMSRFWPVWAGYGLVLLLFQVILGSDDLTYWYAVNVGESITVMGTVNGIFGLVSALMLFGDLFDPRLCSGIHALPLRREQWFSVHIRSGMLFSLIPTAMTAAICEGVICLYSRLAQGWQLPLAWFAAVNLQYIFFFALAVFCVMCTANRFGATVLYGILNFGSLLAYLLVDQIYTPLLRGVVILSAPFEKLSPVVHLCTLRFMDAERTETGRTYLDAAGAEIREFAARFEWSAEGWIYTGIIAAAGILILLAARLMYKRRHLECAGDFLAVRWMEPVFQLVFTVLCGSGFHAIFLLFFGLNEKFVYPVLAAGMLVGWFAGRILLERTSRVFRFRNILGFFLVAGTLAASLYVTYLDPLGIQTWVPDAAELKSVTVSPRYGLQYTAEDPEQMADLIRLHELALEQDLTVHPDYDTYYYNPNTPDPPAARIDLGYVTENGRRAQRKYYVLAEGESGDLIRKYFSRLDMVFENPDIRDAEDLHHLLKDVTAVHVSGIPVPGEHMTEEFIRNLAHAIAADCADGNMVRLGTFHPQIMMDFEADAYDLYSMYLEFQSDDRRWTNLEFYADSRNTLSELKATGVLDLVYAQYANAYG